MTIRPTRLFGILINLRGVLDLKKSVKRARRALWLLLAIAVVAAAFVIYNKSAVNDVFNPYSENELTLIIDAGHGGDDGGAVSPGGMLESTINLAVAERIDYLAAFFGVKTVMTRQSHEIAYSQAASTIRERKAEDQHARLELINSTSNAVFLSIHQNEFTSPEPFGGQALYAGTKGSEEFGKKLQVLLVEHLIEGNRRSAERIQETILLMNNIECPAVLVECAFLSNPTEESLLQTDTYRTKIATVLTAGYLQNREALGAVYGIGAA